MMEFKTGGSVKDVDTEKRIVTGYFTNTGSIDSDQDIFAKGAFKKTILEWGPDGKKRIWHLWQHDSYSPINKPKVLSETAQGVYFETLMPKTQFGDLALALYQEGAITEHSVGFQTLKSEDDEEKGIRTIKEVKMWEGSSVLWGANENTPTVAVKSELQERIKHLEKITKGGNFTDETYTLLLNEIELLKTAISSLEPAQTTQADTEVKKTIDRINILRNLKFKQL